MNTTALGVYGAASLEACVLSGAFRVIGILVSIVFFVVLEILLGKIAREENFSRYEKHS